MGDEKNEETDGRILSNSLPFLYSHEPAFAKRAFFALSVRILSVSRRAMSEFAVFAVFSRLSVLDTVILFSKGFQY